MPPRLDLANQIFGRLTALFDTGKSKNGQAVWQCQCLCGNTKETTTDGLRSGDVRSCGCLRRDNSGGRRHNCSALREYKIWVAMMQRCYNPQASNYKNYGGRGITVDETWHDFINFITDMGIRPTPKHTVERIDNAARYGPENCRWATRKEQATNRRTNVLYTIDGTTKCLIEWARQYHHSAGCIQYRVSVKGWDIVHALTAPSQRKRKP